MIFVVLYAGPLNMSQLTSTTWFKAMVHAMGKSFGLREWCYRKVSGFLPGSKRWLFSLAQVGVTN